MGLAPRRRARRLVVRELVGQADELVGEHAAAGEPRRAVVVVADRDAHPRADVVVDLLLEEADGAGVGVPVEVAAHPVVAVAEAVRVEPALREEQQARRLGGPAGDHDDVRGLLLEPVVLVEVGDARGAPAVVEEDLLDLALGPQPRVAGGERARDHGVLRAVLGVRLAAEAHAPADAHAGGAAVVGHGVDEERGVERVQAQPQRRRLEDLVLARLRRHGRHGQGLLAAGP